MSILSITFHTPENLLEKWEKFQSEKLEQLVDNLVQVEKFILSDVESDMLNEGKNTNLLLIFDEETFRQEFIESEFQNLQYHVQQDFGEDVMVFVTQLNPKKTRI